jgi:hypothetical protein
MEFRTDIEKCITISNHYIGSWFFFLNKGDKFTFKHCTVPLYYSNINTSDKQRFQSQVVVSGISCLRDRLLMPSSFSTQILKNMNYYHYYCHDWGVTIDGVWIGEWIYWPLIHTTRNHKHLTAISLSSTLHKSPQHLLSFFQPAVSWPTVPWQRLLTVEIFQLHALRSSVTAARVELLSTINSTVAPSLLSLPCRNGCPNSPFLLLISADRVDNTPFPPLHMIMFRSSEVANRRFGRHRCSGTAFHASVSLCLIRL